MGGISDYVVRIDGIGSALPRSEDGIGETTAAAGVARTESGRRGCYKPKRRDYRYECDFDPIHVDFDRSWR